MGVSPCTHSFSWVHAFLSLHSSLSPPVSLSWHCPGLFHQSNNTTDDHHITAPPTIINRADTALSSSHPPKTQSPLFVPFNSEDQGGLEQHTNHAWQRSGEKHPHPGGARQLCLHQHPPRQGTMRQTLKHHLRARGHALQKRPLLWDLGRWQGPSTSICPTVMGQLRPAHCALAQRELSARKFPVNKQRYAGRKVYGRATSEPL